MTEGQRQTDEHLKEGEEGQIKVHSTLQYSTTFLENRRVF